MVHGCCRLLGSAGSVGLRRSSSVTRRTPFNIRSCSVCQVRATFDRTSNSPDAICLAIPGIPCLSSGAILVVLLCAAGAAIPGSFSVALAFDCLSVSAELVLALALCTFRPLGSASTQRRFFSGRPPALGAVFSLIYWRRSAARLAAFRCWSAMRTFSDSAWCARAILCMHASGITLSKCERSLPLPCVASLTTQQGPG